MLYRACRCSSGVERFLGKEEVRGSIPLIGSSLFAGGREQFQGSAGLSRREQTREESRESSVVQQ